MKASLLTACLLPATAYAHGFVSRVTIAGKDYSGNVPNASPKDSIVRQIDDTGPVKGAGNADTNCGHDAQRATLVADANPGDVISFEWLAGSDFSKWPHNTGPMLTYMASCGSTPCNEFDSTKARWFKIQEVARKSNGNWAQQDIMNGAAADVVIPKTLAPGNYLIRHEIIALHLATQRGGAEFYPSCAQLRVGGSQTGRPAENELVSFPGAYSDNDPGIYVPEVYSGNLQYTIPGPSIASFVQNSSGGAGEPEDPPPASTSGPAASTRTTPRSSRAPPTGGQATRTSSSQSSDPTSDPQPEDPQSPESAVGQAGNVCRLNPPQDQSLLLSHRAQLARIMKRFGLRR